MCVDDKGFNRTFMELKSEYQKIKFAGLDCFNRTFMELKYRYTFRQLFLN